MQATRGDRKAMSGDSTTVRSDQPQASGSDEQEQPQEQQQQDTASVPVETAQPSTNVALGRGLDVGTANLLSATQDAAGEIVVKRERNAFLEIPAEFAGNRDMLTKLNVPYVSFQNRLYVLGDASFNLANLFGAWCTNGSLCFVELQASLFETQPAVVDQRAYLRLGWMVLFSGI